MIFLFFYSSLAHLEPEPELFEVDEIGDDGDDDLSYHHLPSNLRFPQKVFFPIVLFYSSALAP